MSINLLKSIIRSWYPYAASCGLGILLALAFPPFPLGFIAYAGLLPFIYWMKRSEDFSAFKTGYWWGFGFHTAGVYWIINSTLLGGILSLLFLPLYSAVTLVVLRSIYRNFGAAAVPAFPFIWTGMEYFRTLGVLAFPWLSVGYTQTYYPGIVQFAEYTGVHGVVLWICIINVVIYLGVERIRAAMNEGRKPLDPALGAIVLVLAALFAAPLIHGVKTIEAGSHYGESLRVSLIQGHIDVNEKRSAEFRDYNFGMYQDMTYRAAQEHPDLIVWPETATMSFVRIDRKYLPRLRRIIKNTRIPLLAGSPDAVIYRDGSYITFNSAVLFNRYNEHISDEAQWYAKIRLVPFGEWFPYEDRIPFFEKIDLGTGNFKPGTDYRVMSLDMKRRHIPDSTAAAVDTVRFNVAICFESIFPDFIRSFCEKGSQLMVVVSNVAWFGKTSSLYQHVRIGVLRAIENRIGVAHCSNSGISMLIDPYGNVTNSSGVYVSEILTGDLAIHRRDAGPTFYTRHGEYIGNISVLIAVVFILAGLVRKAAVRRERHAGESSVDDANA